QAHHMAEIYPEGRERQFNPFKTPGRLLTQVGRVRSIVPNPDTAGDMNHVPRPKSAAVPHPRFPRRPGIQEHTSVGKLTRDEWHGVPVVARSLRDRERTGAMIRMAA